MRIQKFLSHAGIASRRHAEALIASGRVFVNGARALVGMRVDSEADTVQVDGATVRPSAVRTCILLHKPRGYVTTRHDPEGRKTVYDLLPPALRTAVWPVGRLDTESEGLLLFTNDGDRTLALTHPRYGIEKEYAVTPAQRLTGPQLAALRRGVRIGGECVVPVAVAIHRGVVHVTVREGKKHEVRKMFAAIGVPITCLRRIRMGGLLLPGDLLPGSWRPLTIAALECALGTDAASPHATVPPERA